MKKTLLILIFMASSFILYGRSNSLYDVNYDAPVKNSYRIEQEKAYKQIYLEFEKIAKGKYKNLIDITKFNDPKNINKVLLEQNQKYEALLKSKETEIETLYKTQYEKDKVQLDKALADAKLEYENKIKELTEKYDKQKNELVSQNQEKSNLEKEELTKSANEAYAAQLEELKVSAEKANQETSDKVKTEEKAKYERLLEEAKSTLTKEYEQKIEKLKQDEALKTKNEIEKVKQETIDKVKAEEKAKYEKLLEEAKNTLTKEYEQKIEKLKQDEALKTKNEIEKVKQETIDKVKAEEKANYEKLLEDTKNTLTKEYEQKIEKLKQDEALKTQNEIKKVIQETSDKVRTEEKANYDKLLLDIQKNEKKNYEDKLEEFKAEQSNSLKLAIAEAREELIERETLAIREKATEDLTTEITQKTHEELSVEYENKKNEELKQLEVELREKLTDEIYEETKAATERFKISALYVFLVILSILVLIFIIYWIHKIIRIVIFKSNENNSIKREIFLELQEVDEKTQCYLDLLNAGNSYIELKKRIDSSENDKKSRYINKKALIKANKEFTKSEKPKSISDFKKEFNHYVDCFNKKYNEWFNISSNNNEDYVLIIEYLKKVGAEFNRIGTEIVYSYSNIRPEDEIKLRNMLQGSFKRTIDDMIYELEELSIPKDSFIEDDIKLLKNYFNSLVNKYEKGNFDEE